MRVRIIGPGRAGRSIGIALAEAAQHEVSYLGRGDELASAAAGVDVVVIATPDSAIEAVAGSVDPDPEAVVLHLAGAVGLDALSPHPRVAALHPLVSLPTPEIGAQRVRGAWFAIAGDPVAGTLVADLGGRSFPIADADRALYHATAAVAANHLVALLGQVERLAAAASVPFEAFVDLALGALRSVAEVGPAAALTGPAARGDDRTIERHLAALPEDEQAAYRALLAEARRLAP